MSDFNARVIKEFRENDGVVGGFFEGRTVLLLHTTGAKSGKQRLHPLVTMQDDGTYFIIASAGGSESHPAWYHNLVANPDVFVEVGTEKFEAVARVAQEPERSRLYEKIAAKMSFFTEYKEKTKGIRVIPVIVLERK